MAFHNLHQAWRPASRETSPQGPQHATSRQSAQHIELGGHSIVHTHLPTRRLGSSKLHITRVGFGAWAIGGGDWSFGWGPQNDDESVAAILHAVDLGINWIDTAAAYGLGHSEVVVGRALHELSNDARPYVFTKCGLVWEPGDRTVPPRRALQPASIRRECEASLRRLGVERIDLYQFHWPDDSTGTPVEDSWETMLRLKDEGKVRAIGVSNFDVPLLERCEAVRHVDSLQPPFSLIRREASEREIPWCAAHHTGVICYSPMQSGILTERFSPGRVGRMAPDDWRRTSAEFQAPRLERNVALRDALDPIADRHGTTVSAVAIAWTLAWRGVTGAIVGARSPGQIDGWIDAAKLRLDRADLEEIAKALTRTGAGRGPQVPATLAA
jgi:aryl-alcohol dehydrogenase-like predicted oxidoreductase